MRFLATLFVVVLAVPLNQQPAEGTETAQDRLEAGAKAKKSSGKQRTLVVSLFGEQLYLDQLEPSNAAAKRKKLSKVEFRAWRQKSLGRRTYEVVWRGVLRRYVKEKKISVSKEEMADLAASVKERLKTSNSALPKNTQQTEEEMIGMMTAWSRASLIDWKVCKSLHTEYGGRVGMGSLGAWVAFDGQNALIEKHMKAGDVRFQDAMIEQAFREHMKIKNFADVYPKGKRLEKLLATPPYKWGQASSN